MPKTSKPNRPPKAQSIYAMRPWECRHYKGRSEIVAYVEASGIWETVATILPTADADPETMALSICRLVNDSRKNQNLLHDAMEALQLCLEDDGLTFSSEQVADRVVAQIKNKMR